MIETMNMGGSAMENTVAAGATVVASPNPPVAATPVVQAAPAPGQTFESGGESSSGGFFKSLNVVEVGFMILGATALYFVIVIVLLFLIVIFNAYRNKSKK